MFLNENQKELVLDASSVFVQNIIEQAKNSAVNIKNNDEFGMCLATWLKKKKRLNIVKWESNNVNYPKFMLLGTDKGILAYIDFFIIQQTSVWMMLRLDVWEYVI